MERSGRLLLLTENYPQLRSSEQFMRLQDELAGTENRIGVARKRYNDAIQDYNTFILQFPQQHLGGHGRLQAERRLLHGQPGGADGAEREVLAGSEGTGFRHQPKTKRRMGHPRGLDGHPAAGWPFFTVRGWGPCPDRST
jgi:hypothetical protein